MPIILLSAASTLSSGILDLAAPGAAGAGPIAFASQVVVDPTLEFARADAPSNPIDNFGLDDKIVIDDFVETSESYVDGHLILDDGPGPGVSLAIPGFTSSLQFSVVTDAKADTTTITTQPCYCRGTLIRTVVGQKPVEDLKIGDEVVTAFGAVRPVKWIGRRTYGRRFIIGRKDVLPIRIKAGALDDNVPARDLWISPHHAMYLDGVLIEAKDLVNGVSIMQVEHAEEVDYFHIELESHDVIVAEGALSESFIDDNGRGMFHNAHEYQDLYPDLVDMPARYCAPRLEDGYEVDAARRRIASRAGLRGEEPTAGSGTLRGSIDLTSPDCIAGWAQNVDHPEAPVCLDVYIDDRLVGQVLANRYRADLQEAGFGSGCHSFEFAPPPGLGSSPHSVQVRRSFDGAVVLPLADAKTLRRSIPA